MNNVLIMLVLWANANITFLTQKLRYSQICGKKMDRPKKRRQRSKFRNLFDLFFLENLKK